jgi:hypothetical protein
VTPSPMSTLASTVSTMGQPFDVEQSGFVAGA